MVSVMSEDSFGVSEEGVEISSIVGVSSIVFSTTGLRIVSN
jgi:hypothetical protein